MLLKDHCWHTPGSSPKRPVKRTGQLERLYLAPTVHKPLYILSCVSKILY